MLNRNAEFFIIDILVSSDAISRHMGNITNAVVFVADELVFTAVTRECEIIGEATNNILKSADLAHLVNPKWRRVVDFRNIISHEYFGLNYEDIFEIIEKDLPVFAREILGIAAKLKDSENFKLALSGAQNDLKKIGRKESLRYLEGLQRSLYGV